MTTIEILSELRSNYNFFDEQEEPVYRALSEAIKAVSIQPERKKGKWKWQTGDVYRCSECETDVHVAECMEEPIYNFCPYCSADMRQRGEEHEDK